MQVDRNTPLVFVDVETTGTSPRRNRVIEVGLMRVEGGKTVDEYRTFVDPGEDVPEFITGITGITTEMIADAPGFNEVAADVEDFLEGGLFVAHNAPFDYGFLAEEFKRSGTSFSRPYLCTVRLSRALFPGYERHNLQSIIERFELDGGSRHRALDDARVLWQLLVVAYDTFGTEHVHKVMHEHVRHPHAQPVARVTGDAPIS